MEEGSQFSWCRPHPGGGSTMDADVANPCAYPEVRDEAISNPYPPNPSEYPPICAPYTPPTHPRPQPMYQTYGPSFSSLGAPRFSENFNNCTNWKNPLVEELRQIARLSFEGNPNQAQYLAEHGFGDCPHDAAVSLLALHQAIPDVQLSKIFPLLDENRTGYVDFWGLITILYALDSKLSCDHCHELIFGAKFWCEECRVGPSKASFGLCFACFQNRKSVHPHQEFINSHLLFERFMAASMLKSGTMDEGVDEQETDTQQKDDEDLHVLQHRIIMQQTANRHALSLW